MYTHNMRKAFYFLLTLAFIALLFRLVDVGEGVALLKNANWSFILIAFALGLLSSFLSATRLRVLLGVFADVNIVYLWMATYVSALISLVFPLSIGGFALSYILSKKLKLSYKKTLGVIVIDYFLGVLVLALLSIVALPYFYFKGKLSFNYVIGDRLYILVLLALMILGVLLMLGSRGGVFSQLKRKYLDKLVNLYSHSRRILYRALLLTLFVAVVGLAHFYLYFLAFDIRVNIFDFAFSNALFGALSVTPGAPAKIGQLEAIGVLTFPYLLGIEKTKVFAALLAKRLISILTILILGSASMYYLKLDKNIFRKIREKL